MYIFLSIQRNIYIFFQGCSLNVWDAVYMPLNSVACYIQGLLHLYLYVNKELLFAPSLRCIPKVITFNLNVTHLMEGLHPTHFLNKRLGPLNPFSGKDAPSQLPPLFFKSFVTALHSGTNRLIHSVNTNFIRGHDCPLFMNNQRNHSVNIFLARDGWPIFNFSQSQGVSINPYSTALLSNSPLPNTTLHPATFSPPTVPLHSMHELKQAQIYF